MRAGPSPGAHFGDWQARQRKLRAGRGTRESSSIATLLSGARPRPWSRPAAVMRGGPAVRRVARVGCGENTAHTEMGATTEIKEIVGGAAALRTSHEPIGV